MTDRLTVREGGFTLLEIVIAVAIVAATVAAGFGISLGSRSLAVSTAAGEFDQFLDSARTIARDLDGATLAFTPDGYGDGTEIRVFAGGPNGQPEGTTLPVLHARAAIEEAESLGKPPFAFIVHANGSLSGRPGYRVGDAATNDVGCPASGAFHFVITAAGASADRFVPCRTALGGGRVTLMTWPPAPIAPSPTPCSGAGCIATALPTAPGSTASCPPSFSEVASGCVPVLSSGPGSGPHYHVTISGAPAAINVGAAGSFTAQATLTNANAVAAGTPASIPVGTQSADATCTATPSGWQPSGSAFSVIGAAAGTCTVTVQGDVSAVPGGTTDTATVSVTIGAAAGATPTPAPPQCDLVSNGKCYRRIVDQTSQAFSKYTLPDDGCGTVDSGCVYIDSIKQILLQPAYGFQPPVLPADNAHELLFRVLKISGIVRQCQPYSYFSSLPAGTSIQWGGDGVGSPVDGAIGWGQPATYLTINHVVTSATANGGFIEPSLTWDPGTTLWSLFEAVATGSTGLPYSFTFSSPAAMDGMYIQWYPDFPGCDAAGDPNVPSTEYGSATAELVFEIYQAAP